MKRMLNARLLILSLTAWQVLGQAPGDFTPTCREGMFAENFPADVRILLDSTDYLNLFEGSGAVWVERDFDGDTTPATNVRDSIITIEVCENSLTL